MQVACKDYLQNYNFQIEINSNESVYVLKQKIEEKLGFKVKLIFYGCLLDQDKKVSYYEFQKHNAVIVLKV